jgi:hypothetical protein
VKENQIMERKKRVVKLFLVAVALAGAILSAGYSLRKDATKASVSRLTFEPTPARLERGRYLVEYLVTLGNCAFCHTPSVDRTFFELQLAVTTE